MNSLIEIVADYSKKQPDKLCLADRKKQISYAEFFRFIVGFSEYLRQMGINKGDPIVVKAIQSIPYSISGMAIQLIGAVFVPLEKVLADERVREIVAITEAKLVIADKEADFGCPFLPYTVIEESYYYNEIPYDCFEFPEGDDTAEILFSTGTTGKSKGIELTHSSVIAVAENVKYGVEMKKNNVELIPVPMNHSHGLRRYYANMLNGSSVVIMDGVVFVNQVFQLMETYQVTAIDLVPAMLAIILKLSKNRLSDFADQLDYIQIGSAKLPDKDKEKLCELLPNARLYDFYGSTEAGCSCIIDFNKFKGKKSCIGKPTCNAVFKFVDDNGKEMETSPTCTGLMACGGSMMMRGYFKEEALTAETVKDGFIYSSDEGYQDEEGFIYLVGRRGDVINIAGMKVDPAEIEEKTVQNPDIADCACVPITDEIAGQAPKLFVVMESGREFSPISIRDFLENLLESYKLPKVIEEIDKIPRTYNGKIIRKELV